MKPKVLITHALYPEGFAELRRHFEVIIPPTGGYTFEQALPLLGEIYALIPTYAFKVTREVIDAAPNLKIVANYGAGYDNIDVAYAASRGVVVTNSPDPVVEPTAEMTYALLLALARRVAESDRKMRTGELQWGVMRNIGCTLHGKTLGIIGMGRIGRAVARYAAASQMRILYHNRRPVEGLVGAGTGFNAGTGAGPGTSSGTGHDAPWGGAAEYVTLGELLARSDFITLHTPLNEATRHLISARELALMKPTAMIVNTARGAVIDERALVAALREGRIAGAALDVFEHEPRPAAELFSMDNVVLTPHAATNTVEARNAMSAFAARNVIDFYLGRTDRMTRV